MKNQQSQKGQLHLPEPKVHLLQELSPFIMLDTANYVASEYMVLISVHCHLYAYVLHPLCRSHHQHPPSTRYVN